MSDPITEAICNSVFRFGLRLSMRAATQLLDANGYVRAVLGGQGADAVR